MDFRKDRAKWEQSMVKRQRLTPRLTATFAYITQLVPIQNMFVI